MNKPKYIILVFLIVLSFAGFTQNLNVSELKPFVLIEKGAYGEGIVLLDELISKTGKKEFKIAKVEALYKLEKFDQALLLCNELNKIEAEIASICKIKILNKLGNDEKLNEAINHNLASKYKIGLFELLNSEEFIDLQSVILDNPNAYSLLDKQLYQTQELIELGNYTQALFMIEEVIERNSDEALAYFLQSKIVYSLGDYRKSNFAVEKAISLNSQYPEFYRQKSKVCIKLKKYKEALESVNKLIRKSPYNIANYILKLEVLDLNEMTQLLNNLSNTLLECVPENQIVLLFNSKSYYYQKDYLWALKSVNKALEIEQTKGAFELRGDIYMKTKTFEFAESDYSMFLDIDPYNGGVYTKKGLARFNSGNQKGACSDWTKAKRYGSYEAAQYLDKYCK